VLALLPHVRAGRLGVEAVRCLGDIGPPAAAAVPALRQAVTSELRQIESGSPVSALDRITPQSMIDD
jgi:hypothetical protein